MSSSTLSTKSKIQNSQSNVLIDDVNSSLQIQKQSIQISKEKLIELVNKNQFIDIVIHLNSKGKQAIQQGKIQLALMCLTEAQKILQYAASSGKNINRSLIVSVLHNQACCYQIIWDLPKCSNYIQALIFNINSQLKYIQNGSNPASEIQVSYLQPLESFKFNLSTINKKMQLSKYYLLFCAINSQLKNNSGALIAAKKANSIITQVFNELKQLNTSSEGFWDDHQQKNTLLEINTLRENVQNKDIQLWRQATKYYIKIFRSKSLFVNQSIQNTVKKFKDFSIGNIMQLEPLTNCFQTSENNISSFQESKTELELAHQKMTEKILILSICCFTIATELRYIAISKANIEKTSDLWKFPEFKQSQILHLKAIVVVALFIPFNIVYMDHIVNSYTNHYKTPLQTGQTLQPTIQEILQYKNAIFITQEQKKCSTTNQSVVVSFEKEDESIQLEKNMFNEYYYVKGQNSSKNHMLMQANLQKKVHQKKYQTTKSNVKFKDISNACKQRKCETKKSKSKKKSSSKSQSKIKAVGNKKEIKIQDDAFKPIPSTIFGRISTGCSPNQFSTKLSKLKDNTTYKSKQNRQKKIKSKTKVDIYGNFSNQYFVFQNQREKQKKQNKKESKKQNQNNQHLKKQRLSKDKKLRKSVSKQTYRSNNSKSLHKNQVLKFKQNKLNSQHLTNLNKNQRASSKRKQEKSSRKTQKSQFYRHYY